MSTTYSIPYKDRSLIAEVFGHSKNINILFLHGAGAGNKERGKLLLQLLEHKGINSCTFDFWGHGETGGNLTDSSLADRVTQAQSVIDFFKINELKGVIGSSMGGYIAIKLLETILIDNLFLFAPGVFTEKAFNTSFGPEFSELIRQEKSWFDSDAFRIMENFSGNLIIFVGTEDAIIPKELIIKLNDSAHNTKRRKLIEYPGVDHALWTYFNSNPRVLKQVDEKISNLMV
jgi:pimeloyl-ACP methyl ester carboxylesterase